MLNELSSSLNSMVFQTQENLPTLFHILGLIWGIFIIDSCIGHRLCWLGIQPRHTSGLLGIVCAPFLHVNFNHIFFNSIPLFVLSDFLLMRGWNFFLSLSIEITLLSGILIWLFAKKGLHVGASAVITGYWAYLVTDMFQTETLNAVVLGVICLYYFAGIFYGLFPGRRGSSWEGHVFGFLSGIIIRYVFV